MTLVFHVIFRTRKEEAHERELHCRRSSDLKNKMKREPLCCCILEVFSVSVLLIGCVCLEFSFSDTLSAQDQVSVIFFSVVDVVFEQGNVVSIRFFRWKRSVFTSQQDVQGRQKEWTISWRISCVSWRSDNNNDTWNQKQWQLLLIYSLQLNGESLL